MFREEETKENFLGTLPKGVLINLLLGVLAIVLTAAWGGPRINISTGGALAGFFLLLGLYFLISLFCVKALPPRKMNKELIKSGPYKFVRHPMYGAVIFLLNPALALILKSWLLILFIVPIYFFWRFLAKEEEFHLISLFKEDYVSYQKETGVFFLPLFKINKIAFAVFWLAVLAIASLISLNLNSFINEFVVFDAQKTSLQQKTETKPSGQKSSEVFKAFAPSDFALAENRFYATVFNVSNRTNSSLNPSESPALAKRTSTLAGDSLNIGKLNLDAPLIFPANNIQAEINQALDRGVIVYPGSSLPPDFGNLFLTGHSSVYFWNKTPYGKIFIRLNELEKGDEISINLNGFSYIYTVSAKQIVSPDEVRIINQPDRHTLTLMTCWPLGTDKQRLLIFAELKN